MDQKHKKKRRKEREIEKVLTDWLYCRLYANAELKFDKRKKRQTTDRDYNNNMKKTKKSRKNMNIYICIYE